ncbi:hypothetical protein [Pontibacter ruber]|uniref:Uncharacterized protein n=1 Tax=Pontibacter ruber TaxID=1343895 RepID=A0ABW5CZS6_9BACT|nr:hypothetical protein [Pontibacter ruber]
MESLKLSHLNPSFRVEGSEKRRSLEIDHVLVTNPPQPSGKLKLMVLDEKDVTIYSQPLEQNSNQADAVVRIDKKFVFYDHLTVRVTSEPAESAFEITVTFN